MNPSLQIHTLVSKLTYGAKKNVLLSPGNATSSEERGFLSSTGLDFTSTLLLSGCATCTTTVGSLAREQPMVPLGVFLHLGPTLRIWVTPAWHWLLPIAFLLKVRLWTSGLGIPWELHRNRVSGPIPDLLNQNLHFNKILR